jgi:hypothetical protein
MALSSPRAEVLPRNFLEKGGHQAKGGLSGKVMENGGPGKPSSFDCRDLIARHSLRF